MVVVALTGRKQEMLDGFLANVDRSEKQIDGLGECEHRRNASVTFKVRISSWCEGKKR